MASKTIFIASVLIAIIATAAVTSGLFIAFYKTGTSTTSSQGVTQVTRYVGGLTADEAPAYAAEAQGYFAQNGIDVTPVILSGTSAAEVAVAAGSSPDSFALGDLYDLASIAVNNASLNQLVETGSTGIVNPVGMIFLTSSGITGPSSLVGKTIGVPFGSESYNMFIPFLKNNGVSLNQVNIQNIGFSDLADALFAHSVDAIVEFASDYAALQPQGVSLNEPVSYILFSSYGLPPVGSGIVMQQNLVKNDPSVARAITNATLYGYYYCIKNPGPCVQDFVNINPSFNYTSALAEWQASLIYEVGYNATTIGTLTPLQFGYIAPTTASNIVTLAVSVQGLTSTPDATSLYTDQFVQQPPS
ncbi:MAG: ABC transporter substrate-binding protein [Nitrososphaerales archaeon]